MEKKNLKSLMFFAMSGITNNYYPKVKSYLLRKSNAFYLAVSKSLFNFA